RGTQVIVVDDGSTDDSRFWLAEKHPWVEMLALPTNQGFCQAMNAGLALARGTVVEMLNNDTQVCRYWAQAALAHFADPTVGSVAPLVVFWDRPNVIDSAGQEYHRCGWGKNRGYGKSLNEHYLESCDVFGPSGSSGFYRRSVLQKVGMLLPEYGAYYEDVDLSFRLRWAGFRCIYEPGSRVFHKESGTYRQQRDHVVRLLARNEELVFWINLQTRDLLLGLIPHLGFLAVRALRKTLQGQGGTFFAAKWEAFKKWRWVVQRRRELQRLARSTGEPVDLEIDSDPRIIQEGWKWMTRRKSA
ncbi:MAG TPA: glycosyltransferase, partial [Gemmataceae bacterium]|nr:glycosyltransferase [Gemmataceae bacterium]